MEIDGKMITYGFAIILVLLLVLYTFGVISFNGDTAGRSSGGSSNIPEKCQIPKGQDVNSWKEHLSHHAETKDCLKYFN